MSANQERCPVCDKELNSEEVDSCSVICWHAWSESNVLVQMFCSLDHIAEWLSDPVNRDGHGHGHEGS